MWCPLKISPGSIGYCPKKSKNSKIFEFGVVNHISSKNFHPDPEPVKSMYFLHFLWKEPMLRWLSGVFPCVSGLIPLQGKSEYGWILVPGGQIGLFHLQELWRASWPQGPPDREKSFNLSPRDLGPSPLNAGQVFILIYVSHLGSSLLLSWATRWIRSGKSRGTSTGPPCSSALSYLVHI